MLVVLLPVLAGNVFLALGSPINYGHIFPLPLICKIMLGVAYVVQIIIAYFVSLLFDWTLDAAGKRDWVQLKLSTCLAMMIFSSGMIYWSVSASEKILEYHHYSVAIVLWTSLKAISFAAAPLFIIAACMFLSALANVAGSLTKTAPKQIQESINAMLPADSRLKHLSPNYRERIIGGLPLVLFVILMITSAAVVDDILPVWKQYRLNLEGPSVWSLSWYRLTLSAPWLPFFIGASGFFFYWNWVSRDHQRIFWFNVVVVALLLFGLLALALGVALPFVDQSCVAEGSEVDTPKGKKLIEDLKVGDKVLARSAGGELQSAEVKHIRYGVAESLICVRLDGEILLLVTAEHPLALTERWVRAGELCVGDVVLCREGLRTVVALEKIQKRTNVYDISVSPHHNFFANGVLVHNALKKK